MVTGAEAVMIQNVAALMFNQLVLRLINYRDWRHPGHVGFIREPCCNAGACTTWGDDR